METAFPESSDFRVVHSGLHSFTSFKISTEPHFQSQNSPESLPDLKTLSHLNPLAHGFKQANCGGGGGVQGFDFARHGDGDGLGGEGEQRSR